MQYFILKQYEKLINLVSIPTIKSDWNTTQTVRQEFHTAKKDMDTLLPIYTRPNILLLEDAYRIIANYQIGQRFKGCAILNPEIGINQFYYYMNPFELDCLHETTQRNQDQSIKKIVLNRSKIGWHKVFRPADIRDSILIIDLEILGKLLCAGVYPIEWEEVRCV